MKARLNNLFRNLDGKLLVTFETNADPEEIQTFKDKDLEITIQKERKARSLDANKLLWAMIGDLAMTLRADKWDIYLMMLKRYGKYTYVSLKPEAVDDFVKSYRECEVIAQTEEAVMLLCYFGSSTYTQEEFSRLLDGVISEAKEAGIHMKASDQVEELYRQWARK